MSHSFSFINYIDHRHTSQLAGIEKLSAGGGIERGAVKIDSPTFVASLDDRGFEFTQIGVSVIEAFGQGTEGFWELSRPTSHGWG